MAAAADRHPGDVLERVSPELVLVDAALAEEMRRRLDVPDDTVIRSKETDVERSALTGGEPLPVPATALDVAHRNVGIEDLLVLPEGDPPSVPRALEETVTPRVSRLALPADDQAEPRGSYPRLPSPSSDPEEEDASAVVLRQICYHAEPETPPKRRRRLLSFVSLFAALCSMAIYAVALQLGVSELPHWLPS